MKHSEHGTREATCPICGKKFVTWATTTRKYCSDDCSRIAQRGNYLKRKAMVNDPAGSIIYSLRRRGKHTTWEGPGKFASISSRGDTLWFAANEDGTFRCELESGEEVMSLIPECQEYDIWQKRDEDGLMLVDLTRSEMFIVAQIFAD